MGKGRRVEELRDVRKRSTESSTGCLGRSSVRNVDSKDDASEGLDGNKDSIRNRNTGHFCYMLAKNFQKWHHIQAAAWLLPAAFS